MPKALLRLCSAAALSMLLALPAHAQMVDLTQMFNNNTRALADSERVSVGQQMMREGRAFADVKPAEVGDKATFNTYNLEKNTNEKIQATLKKIGKHCYVYVATGAKVDAKSIDKLVNAFDNKIYPEDRSMFGEEWNPGIDDDARITLLLLDIKDGYNPSTGNYAYTGGYFNAGDCYTKEKYPTSNQREMLYLDVNPSDPSSDKFLSVVAHEFQHMIHWNHDPKEFTWVNESMSQLASYLCGYGHPSQVDAFLRSPDNNMCAWSDDDMVANYGQVYMWAQYISTHIASTDERRRSFIRKMVGQTSHGMSGINAAIEKQGIKNNAKTLFKNFCVANYLNDNSIANGAYGYDNNLSRFYLDPEIKIDKAPFKGKSSVKCWSAKAIKINPASFKGNTITVNFAGQKIATTEYSNAFDVAVVNYASDGNTAPSVTWLNVKDFKACQQINVSSKHDRMMLVVVHRGSEVMKVEQAFAKNCGAANFAFALSAGNEPVKLASSTSTKAKAAKKTTTKKKSTKKKTSKSILNEMFACMDQTSASSEKLGKGSEEQQQETNVEYELAQQRLKAIENLFLANVKQEINGDTCELAEAYITHFVNAGPIRKLLMVPSMRRLIEVLNFEKLNGNERAAQLLEMLEAYQQDPEME